MRFEQNEPTGFQGGANLVENRPDVRRTEDIELAIDHHDQPVSAAVVNLTDVPLDEGALAAPGALAGSMRD